MIQDKRNALQVVGSIFQRPHLLSQTDKYNFDKNDFIERTHNIMFSAVYNMYHSGTEKITVADFHEYLSKYPALYNAFEAAGGNETLLLAIEISDPRNFNFYFDRLKKLAMLRDIQAEGYDVSDWYLEDIHDIGLRQELVLKLEQASLQEIVHSYLFKISDIESKFLNRQTFKLANASEGLVELKESLKEDPEVGLNFEGDLFTTVTRGARRGKFYLLSGESGTGKSRNAVMQACRLSLPIRWNIEKKKWENVGGAIKSLLITTELDLSEIQSMLLAYVSGVNEENILNGDYQMGEEERVDIATKIIEHYQDHLIIYHMPDPNIEQLNSNVRRLVLSKQLDALFFDYIHTSPSLLGEFSAARIREDVALGMLSAALKNLANELNIVVWSGTQVNREARDAEFADMSTLRGSRGIGDKLDFGSVLRAVRPDFLKDIEPLVKGKPIEQRPNFFIDIYKNRRSRYKDVRLWVKLDLGTLRMETLYITDRYGQQLAVPFITKEDPDSKVDVEALIASFKRPQLEEEEPAPPKSIDLSSITL